VTHPITGPPSPIPLSRAVLVGIGAGALSGTFGVGGGVLMVPAMVIWLGLDQRRAAGTSLAAIVPIALLGVVGFAVQDQLDYPAAALLATGAVVAAPIGARLIHAIPVNRLRLGFALLLLATATRLLFELPEPVLSESITTGEAVAVVAVGFASGLLAGLFGVGGGILMVPAQMLILGIDPATAKGTSLLVIIPTAVSGTIANVRAANTDLRLAGVLGIAGVVTSFAGAFVATRMSRDLASALFALLLVVSAGRMLEVTRWVTGRRGARPGSQDEAST
jgi:uncharacterized protein